MLTPFQQFIKRTFDIIVGTVALVLTGPLMLLIVVLIRIDSPGPVIFRQRRLGQHGQEFHILKFRTLTSIDDGDYVPQVTYYDAR